MQRTKIPNKLLVVLAVTTGALALLLGALIANPPAPSAAIYSNMYIHGIPVGGLTSEEAEAALMEQFQPNFDDVTISFTHAGEVVAERTYRELGIKLDFSEAIQAARDYSNRRNLPSRVMRMLGRAHKITVPPTLNYDPNRLESQLTYIASNLQVPPTNARLVYEGGNVNIWPEADGQVADIAAASTQLAHLLAEFDGGEVEFTTSPIPPRYTTADMQFNVSLLGTYNTPVDTTNEDARLRNVRRAAHGIHNHVLHPGDVFSASELVGAHLPGINYEAAVVLVRGEPVEDIGGGICQVVTTLYNAVLLAELTVVQRHNHSARVSYADFGFDATIAGDYYDFKFRNTTPHVILIVSQLERGALVVNIFGSEQRPQNRSIQFSSRRMDITSPEPYKEVVDANLAPGERVVTLESQLGYKYEVYKHVYIDGREVEQVRINTSTYRPLQGIISVGRQ